MPSRRPHPDPDDEDEEEEETSRGRAPRSGGRHRRPPIRSWSDEEEDDEEEPDHDRRGSRRSRPRDETSPPSKTPVYFRARDSVYFEPLLAAAILVVLIVGLSAYTQNWPPMYVVESSSMQHGSSDQVGLINTGDLVLAQKVSGFQVTTYEAGAQIGYSTYGEYGDVILYHPNGLVSTAPIIHRAILYIEVHANSTYTLPDLTGQPCGPATNAVYAVSSTPTGCGTENLAAGTLTLFHVGWRSASVIVDLSSLGPASGYLTMGDNNFGSPNGSLGDPDQPFLTSLVQPGWVVGVARGMLPWFGSLKLLLDGNAGEVPPQSWQFMGLTVVGLVLVAVGIHYFLRAEGIEDERRKEDEREARRRAGPPRAGERWHWPHPLRDWGDEDEEDEEEEEDEGPRRHRRTKETARSSSWFGGGRPRPTVGRGRHHRSRSEDDDEDL